METSALQFFFCGRQIRNYKLLKIMSGFLSKCWKYDTLFLEFIDNCSRQRRKLP